MVPSGVIKIVPLPMLVVPSHFIVKALFTLKGVSVFVLLDKAIV
jgi:hypothetical protein